MTTKKRLLRKKTPELKEQVRLRFEAREAHKAHNRVATLMAYRKKNRIELVSCARSLDFIDTLVNEVAVFTKGQYCRRNMPVVGLPDLADALQVSEATLNRRIREDVIPSPIFHDRIGKRYIRYYHAAEAKLILQIVGEHEFNFAYLRKDHKDVLKRLRTEVATLRKTF